MSGSTTAGHPYRDRTRVDPVDSVVGLEMGADEYIAKPFDRRELVSRVRAVLLGVAYLPTGAFTSDDLLGAIFGRVSRLRLADQ